MKRIWDINELAEHWSLKFEETRLLKTKHQQRPHITALIEWMQKHLENRPPWHE